MISRRRWFAYFIFVSSVILNFTNCAGPEKSSPSDGLKNDEKTTHAAKASDSNEDQGLPPSALNPTSRTMMMFSMSNNGFTSGAYNLENAISMGEGISAEDRTPLSELEDKLSAQRLARSEVSLVWPTLTQIAQRYTKKNIKSDLPETIKIEMAVVAINQNDFDLAEYFLDGLYDSKNAQVKATAYNLLGLIYLEEGRFPEAVSQWKAALAQNASYKPAALNLGILALRYGDFPTAKKYLDGDTSDWYLQSLAEVIDRNTNNVNGAKSLCERLLKDHDKNQAILFNCAVYFYQEEKNFAHAKKLLNASIAINKGPASWNERAYQVLGRIEDVQLRETQRKEEELAKKREETQRKKVEAAPSQNTGAASESPAQPAAKQGSPNKKP